MSEHERRYEIVWSHSPDVVERVVAERMSEGWRPVGGIAYGHDGGGCVWAQAIVNPPEEQRDERISRMVAGRDGLGIAGERDREEDV